MYEDKLIIAKNITKKFPGVLALDNVNFDLNPGEVHVLLGENGAGKSTLIKTFSGANSLDSGELYYCGKKIESMTTQESIEMGIATCYQEFNLIPYLTVAENMYLGRYPYVGGLPVIDKKKLNEDAKKIIESINIDLDPSAIVSTLGVALQQMAEIAKALTMDAKVFILDEPTAVLSNKEIDELFRVIRMLRSRGAGIIYISHRLEELPIIGDRVTIMRDGKSVRTLDISGISVSELIYHMVGRKMDQTYPKINDVFGGELLRTEGLSLEGVFKDINISVKAGEIVGLSGLVGSKRTDVLRGIYGADKITAGQIYIEGRPAKIASPKTAVKKGISLLPEDRKKQGVVLIHSIKENVTLPSLKKYTKFGVINDCFAKQVAEKFVNQISIKTTSLDQKVKNLSGGNQQKVIVAKWLASESEVFLFDEPTRGIDVGAKAEIYALMNELVKENCGIIMVSSELPEIINMCNRVYVMRNGEIVKELDNNGEKLTENEILKYAMLGRDAEEKEQVVF